MKTGTLKKVFGLQILNKKTSNDDNASTIDGFVSDHINNIVNADDNDTARRVLMDIITDTNQGQFKYYEEKQQQKIIDKKNRLTAMLLDTGCGLND